MDKLKAIALRALDGLTGRGAAQAQCYIERLTNTELRVEAGEPESLRVIEQTLLKLTAIDANKRVGRTESTLLADKNIEEAIDGCIRDMLAASPDENACIAEKTENGSFTSGATVCDVKALFEYDRKLLDKNAAERKARGKEFSNTDWENTYTHVLKQSALFNTNGVRLDQTIGWFEADDAKTPSLDTDTSSYQDEHAPYGREEYAALPDGSIDEKFVGTVLLRPRGFWHLWWLSRMVLLNDNATIDGYDDMPTPWINSKGQKIVSDKLTVEERLLDPRLAGVDMFTSEGYPTRNIRVIDHGVMDEFPLSEQAAKKLGREVNAAPHEAMKSGRQVFVQAGDTPVADMLKGIEKGLLLGSLAASPEDATGEMTGVVAGALIENGKLTKKVRCMISCNFFELLNNISAVSCETQFSGEWETPWIAFEGVHIS